MYKVLFSFVLQVFYIHYKHFKCVIFVWDGNIYNGKIVWFINNKDE